MPWSSPAEQAADTKEGLKDAADAMGRGDSETAFGITGVVVNNASIDPDARAC